jgi:hypothetical protein
MAATMVLKQISHSGLRGINLDSFRHQILIHPFIFKLSVQTE